ncbi:unnamed protein product [Rotaria sp. Silwood1]|nr:unnamed protein product [Rotaria sp. Silwood1]
MMAFNILKQLEEPETKSLDEHIINCIKRAAHQSLKMNKNKIIMNINPNKLPALRSLMKADKGSSCIIMDKEQYIIKVKVLLSAGTAFQKIKDKDKHVNQDTTENIVKIMENKLNYRINDLKKCKRLTEQEYNFIRTSGSRCAVLFCQPKVHKQGMPLRPIISTTNNNNYKLAKYLTILLLEEARTKPKSYIKDSFTFAKLIQQQKPQRNDIMLSLDIESLFTNTPVHEAMNLAIKIIMKKKQEDNRFTMLNEEDLKHRFYLAVTNTPFRFYNELYLQVDGVSMDSPLASILADIFMEHIEQELEKFEDNNKIKFYRRYVDDTFIIFNGKQGDIDKLLNYVNSLHPNLKFTNEVENDYELSFLDVKVIKQRTKFETTILQKENTYSICSSETLLTEECNIIEKTLVKNEYPVKLVKRKINNTIQQFRFSQPTVSKSLKKMFFVPLTYYGIETIIMTNKIKNILEKTYPTTKVMFCFKKDLTINKLFMKNYKGVDPMIIGVIYKLSCSKCSKVYIGQTQLNVKERMKQHHEGLKDPGKSSAADHMLNNAYHVINFKDPEILGRDISKKRLEIKETLCTIKYNNAYNKISHELARGSNIAMHKQTFLPLAL